MLLCHLSVRILRLLPVDGLILGEYPSGSVPYLEWFLNMGRRFLLLMMPLSIWRNLL